MLWANRRLRLVVTAECNIACFYCHNEGQPKSAAHMATSILDRVEALVRESPDPLEAITVSGGEPLLHPDIEGIVERFVPYANRRTLVSNGWLLNPEKLSALKAAGLTKLRIGIDSLRRDKSRPTSGSAPTRPIRDTIDLLLTDGFAFELNCVLTRYNAEEIRPLLSFCQSHHVSAKFFEMLANTQMRPRRNT